MLEFICNKIYFIESLDGNHKQSADDLFNYHISNYFPNISEKKSVSSKVEVFSILENIIHETSEGSIFPLLHIESHGMDTRKGLVLSNNDNVSWKDLSPYFVQINKNCCNNLTLCLAACSSIYILEEIILSFYEFGSITPFFAFIGSEDIVEIDDLTNAFPEFYKKFLETKSTVESVIHMNNFSESTFRTDNCHSIFRTCANQFSNTWIKERGKRILANPDILNTLYCKLYNYTYERDCSLDMINELMVSEQLYVDFFNKRMEDFFIYDCKGNKDRFGTISKINNFKKCEIFMRKLS